MKFYNIMSTRTYSTPDGEEKTRWMKCGEVKISDQGGKFMTMYSTPDVDYRLLPDKDDQSEDLLVIE